jgi:hypothetical protein
MRITPFSFATPAFPMSMLLLSFDAKLPPAAAPTAILFVPDTNCQPA